MWLKSFRNKVSQSTGLIFYKKCSERDLNMKSNEIEAVIRKIKAEACLSEEETFLSVEEYLTDMIGVYQTLLDKLPEYIDKGIDIPSDIILQQVKNLDEAVRRKDLIKLYDTLKYEVINTFELYREIQIEMGQ